MCTVVHFSYRENMLVLDHGRMLTFVYWKLVRYRKITIYYQCYIDMTLVMNYILYTAVVRTC